MAVKVWNTSSKEVEIIGTVWQSPSGTETGMVTGTTGIGDDMYVIILLQAIPLTDLLANWTQVK